MNNKFKSLIFVVCAIIALPIFSACTKKTTLETPTNLKVKYDYSITWNGVDDADYYCLEINGSEYDVLTTSFSASSILSQSGIYNIKVCAYTYNGKYKVSQYSKVVTFDNRTELDQPELTIQDYVLSWNPIENANTYILEVNGLKYTTTETQFDLMGITDFDGYLIKGQQNSFAVYCCATSNYKTSLKSQTKSIYLAITQDAPQNVSMQKTDDLKVLLTFGKVATASNGYTIYIDDIEQTIEIIQPDTDKVSVDVTNLITSYGEHTFAVRCKEIVADGITTHFKSATTEKVFEYIPDFVNVKVQKVSLDNTDFNLTFSAVSETSAKISASTTYDICIKNVTTDTEETKNVSSTSVNISTSLGTVGHYEITVTAKNGEYSSLASDKCLYSSATTLTQPTIIAVENDEKVNLTLDSSYDDSNVSGYKIVIGTNVVKTSSLPFEITSYLDIGKNTIYCNALGDDDLYLDSASTSISFTYVVAGVPENLAVKDGVLSFNAVTIEGVASISYNVYLNDSLLSNITTTSLDVSTECSTPDIYDFKVSTVADGKESKFTKCQYVVKCSAPSNLNVSAVSNKVLLNFDAVIGATSYSIYVDDKIVLDKVETNVDINITEKVSAGDNSITVVANGSSAQLESLSSEKYVYNHIVYMEQVKNIKVTASAGEYYLSFDKVEKASAYKIQIFDNDSQSIYNETLSQNADINISSIVTYSGDYSIEITTENTIKYIDLKATQSVSLKTYNDTEYQSQKFFYDGKDYTYCIKSKYDFEDFIFYNVLYRTKTPVEVYVDFDEYNNVASGAYTSSSSLLDQFIPSVAKFGVDLDNGTDNMLNTLIEKNVNNLQAVITFLERCHDQIYLYYKASSILTSQKSNKVYTISFTYYGDDEATNHNTMPSMSQANMPVGYTEAQTPAERTFAIDSLENYAPVSTVAQLLMVVQNGRKPQFVGDNTIAEQTYNKAKEVLKKICTDDMTDYQKILAIHDYIVTNNVYDSVTCDVAKGAPFSSSNLSEMAFYASGMLLNNLSVCKGISQAFALMCNIEGIKAIECFGLTGGVDWSTVDWKTLNSGTLQSYSILMNLYNHISDIGAHSWNRVLLDGTWYVVDCTWDDFTSGSTEVLRHEYFLVDDTKIATDHKEFYGEGTYYKPTDASGNEIAYNANIDYGYYASTDGKLNTLISSQEGLNTVVENMLTNKLSGFEFKFDDSVSSSDYSTIIETALTNSSLSVDDYVVVSMGQTICVYVKA